LAEDEAELLRDVQALTHGPVTVESDPLLHQEQFDLVTDERA
jgi:hypothetical protein